ncbi:A disintegrin and metalloproteinase with thrombospondin motifs 1-like [Dermacentor andersoni]|uniref:A disintegrin and metalloproteinase with thrombospondin motifs 1-like n=1 Tax=Dermacentor andersoni TaxID=34620 RepID=UPI003B3B8304
MAWSGGVGSGQAQVRREKGQGRRFMVVRARRHQILAGKSRHTKAILDLDLECAFDIISHSTILERIYLLPPILRERTYNYLRDFLSNRKAFLSVRDISSEQLSLGRTGTPQGIANSEGACGPNNVLTVSDQGKDDLTSFGLAHEISHAIGAVHDGEGTADSCFDVGYVMSPYMIPSANPSYSPCSIADIQKFLGKEDSDCLFEHTGDPQLDANRAAHCSRFLARGQKLLRTETDGPCSFLCYTGRKSSFRLPERDGKPCNKFDASQMCNEGNCI